MNSLSDMVRAFKPDKSYLSIDVEIPLLISKFSLSPSEAAFLQSLLREYQTTSSSTAIRQHVYKLRSKLKKYFKYNFGSEIIVSVGLKFYAIPEPIKEAINVALRN